MAIWQDTLVMMVRHLANDLSSTQNFTDNRIRQAIVVSGLIAAQEYDFTTEYTFDLGGVDIIPDPVENNDTLAIALFTLKTACLLNMNSYQTAIGTGIKVRDGDSQVDTTGSFGGYKDILTLGPCASYKKLLETLRFKKSMNSGRAIVTPASHENFYLGGTLNLYEFFNRLI